MTIRPVHHRGYSHSGVWLSMFQVFDFPLIIQLDTWYLSCTPCCSLCNKNRPCRARSHWQCRTFLYHLGSIIGRYTYPTATRRQSSRLGRSPDQTQWSTPSRIESLRTTRQVEKELLPAGFEMIDGAAHLPECATLPVWTTCECSTKRQHRHSHLGGVSLEAFEQTSC